MIREYGRPRCWGSTDSRVLVRARRRAPSLCDRRVPRVKQMRRVILSIWVMSALVGGVAVVTESVFTKPKAETEAFESVYYAALLSGRDPDAALRKARFRTELLMKDFGESKSRAAAEVARFMIWRAGSLCGG